MTSPKLVNVLGIEITRCMGVLVLNIQTMAIIEVVTYLKGP